MPERPLRGAPDRLTGLFAELFQQRPGLLLAGRSQRIDGIAPEPVVARPRERGPRNELRVLLGGEPGQLHHAQARDGPGGETGVLREDGLAIERTHVLADVTAKDEAVHREAEGLGHLLAAVLDGLVGQACAGIHAAVAHQRPRGTRQEAPAAGATPVRGGPLAIGIHLGVEDERGQQHPGAIALGDEAAVLPHVAHPRAGRPHLLHHRPAVHAAVSPDPRVALLERLAEGLHPVPQRRVVVPPPGVPGNGRVGGLGIIPVIVVGEGHHRLRPGQEQADIQTLRRPFAHPIHVGRVASLHPGAERFGRNGLRAREAHQVEANGFGELTQPGGRQGTQGALLLLSPLAEAGYFAGFSGIHFTSATPARWLATRAMTKSRSERRLRKTTVSAGTVASRTRGMTRRSALRHTVRARCSALDACVPPGRMKWVIFGSSPSKASMACSMASTHSALSTGMCAAALVPVGVASTAPTVKSCSWSWCRSPPSSAGRERLRARPSVAFSSSTSPYASTRASSFGTRPPPKSPVSPASPLFV
ncbi:hypothetical protein STIAU_7989 [Stigmatella aurantiaca DW4/3-1]|uniref:Uncharacterized protein n=1 Tax=Stigmatella aurantiaca (strain DW4/3-1) TaxID=378806 RepID=Q09C46_STIAD|nr:hypothetical protein STIAU_7989 [Stigmatella aurantiaca DW4/3-1]